MPLPAFLPRPLPFRSRALRSGSPLRSDSSLRPGWVRFFPLLLSSIVLFSASPSFSQSLSHPISTHRDWTAYEMQEEAGQVCFILSEPKKVHPANVRRGEIQFFVANWPSDGVWNQPVILFGYPIRDGAEIKASIGNKIFFLQKTDEESAHAFDEVGEKMVQAMKSGVKMTVEATSKRGTATRDDYSLLGVTRALRRIDKACGRK